MHFPINRLEETEKFRAFFQSTSNDLARRSQVMQDLKPILACGAFLENDSDLVRKVIRRFAAIRLSIIRPNRRSRLAKLIGDYTSRIASWKGVQTTENRCRKGLCPRLKVFLESQLFLCTPRHFPLHIRTIQRFPLLLIRRFARFNHSTIQPSDDSHDSHDSTIRRFNHSTFSPLNHSTNPRTFSFSSSAEPSFSIT